MTNILPKLKMLAFVGRAITLSSIALPTQAEAWIQRAPDYADASGKDWIYNHDIPDKKYAGEPSADPGVDLFYLYPTSVYTNNYRTVDGICDIDDAFLRGPEGAVYYWNITGAVFGDFTRVYAPYYRQVTVDAFTNLVQKVGVEHASEFCADYCRTHVGYTDVTNALTHYFTAINKEGERPFILAAHSQGSCMLRNVMTHFFTNATQKAWLKNMVACYAVGYGLGPETENAIKDLSGVSFATNATDTGVYIMWNTEGAGTPESMRAGLWPSNAVAAVNPITWTRTQDAYASPSLNLGGWTTNEPALLLAGLYDASNYIAHGTIVCSSEAVTSQFSREGGLKSLHNWDYLLYWDNIRANGLQRIKTWKAAHGIPVNAQIPLPGRPIDYSNTFNWVTNSIATTGITRGVDALFFYPTCEMTGDSTFVPISEAHKAKAFNWCKDKVSAFADYANIIIPAYRQMNMTAVVAGQALYPTASEFFDFLRRALSRTDFFAALDYYFTEINPNGTRPFFFAGHSQGSAQIKVLLQDYFTREENETKLNNLIAAYALGYSFSADWIDDLDLGLKAAKGEADTKVIVSWNTEGTNAQARSFVVEDGAIAINPMNWTTTKDVWSKTTPDAMIQERAGYLNGTSVLVTTNSETFARPEIGMGERSLHILDWSLWYDQIKANAVTRLNAMPLPGSKNNPWLIGATAGDAVIAWTNGTGTLLIEGSGNMMDFGSDGAGIPWTTKDIAAVTLATGVTQIGTNAWYGLVDGVTYNGISSSALRTIADGFGGSLGYIRTKFRAVQSADGIFSMAVALETAPSLTNDWAEVALKDDDATVDANGHIVIDHASGTQKQGFYTIQPVK